MVLDAVIAYLTTAEDIAEVKRRGQLGHPFAPIAIPVFYVLFCKWIGPALMKNRKPFDLRVVIISYNFAQMFVNSYILSQLVSLLTKLWDIRCLRSASPLYHTILNGHCILGFQILLVKYIDLFDTVFFVLRKKDKQISFLHVFHHIAMCLLAYVLLVVADEFRYSAGIGITINSFIHVVMYLYYALAAFGPRMQKYLWWKKYLTQMQMIQFVIVLLYLVVNIATGCEEADAPSLLIAFCLTSFLLLFANFYRKSFKTE